MIYFLCKLILPPPDFVQTMTDSEKNKKRQPDCRYAFLFGMDDLKRLHGAPINELSQCDEARSHFANFILGCSGERTDTRDEDDHRNSEVHHNA